ncbi:MAG: PDZ domain-containing protein, partial [Chloroflexota bacterium]|nr:PDZ domain-containing protein [Chloroflexota bacterium]
VGPIREIQPTETSSTSFSNIDASDFTPFVVGCSVGYLGLFIGEDAAKVDIVRRHLNEHAAAVQKIVRVLHYSVVGELEQEGQECQCSCPSCGLGICLCATASRRFLGIAWTDAGPIYVPEPILMVKPRTGSAAARAGIQKGDIVLMVDGKDIESIPMLQDTVRNHKSSEEIHFQVQQKSGERVEITVLRP